MRKLTNRDDVAFTETTGPRRDYPKTYLRPEPYISDNSLAGMTSNELTTGYPLWEKYMVHAKHQRHLQKETIEQSSVVDVSSSMPTLRDPARSVTWPSTGMRSVSKVLRKDSHRPEPLIGPGTEPMVDVDNLTIVRPIPKPATVSIGRPTIAMHRSGVAPASRWESGKGDHRESRRLVIEPLTIRRQETVHNIVNEHHFMFHIRGNRPRQTRLTGRLHNMRLSGRMLADNEKRKRLTRWRPNSKLTGLAQTSTDSYSSTSTLSDDITSALLETPLTGVETMSPSPSTVTNTGHKSRNITTIVDSSTTAASRHLLQADETREENIRSDDIPNVTATQTEHITSYTDHTLSDVSINQHTQDDIGILSTFSPSDKTNPDDILRQQLIVNETIDGISRVSLLPRNMYPSDTPLDWEEILATRQFSEIGDQDNRLRENELFYRSGSDQDKWFEPSYTAEEPIDIEDIDNKLSFDHMNDIDVTEYENVFISYNEHKPTVLPKISTFPDINTHTDVHLLNSDPDKTTSVPITTVNTALAQSRPDQSNEEHTMASFPVIGKSTELSSKEENMTTPSITDANMSTQINVTTIKYILANNGLLSNSNLTKSSFNESVTTESATSLEEITSIIATGINITNIVPLSAQTTTQTTIIPVTQQDFNISESITTSDLDSNESLETTTEPSVLSTDSILRVQSQTTISGHESWPYSSFTTVMIAGVIGSLNRRQFTWMDVIVAVTCTAAILMLALNVGLLMQYFSRRRQGKVRFIQSGDHADKLPTMELPDLQHQIVENISEMMPPELEGTMHLAPRAEGSRQSPGSHSKVKCNHIRTRCNHVLNIYATKTYSAIPKSRTSTILC